MLIEKIPEWDLSSQDDAEIAALLARCFPTDFGGRSYFIQHHHLRLVVRQPQIIGHMALVLRSVQLGDRLVSIAGLAEVATDPAHRGQGIAAQLLQAAIAEPNSCCCTVWRNSMPPPVFAISPTPWPMLTCGARRRAA